jgi:hypothetical protein
MRRRASQKKLQRIDEILPRVLNIMQIPYRSEDRRLINIWQKAVGSQIASQSRPENLRKDILFVKVSTSVWMQQLYFLKGELIEKVNALMGKTRLRDIRFSIGQLPASGKTREDPSTMSFLPHLLKERDEKMIEACLAALKDQDLKDILRRAMTREITWRRSKEKKFP